MNKTLVRKGKKAGVEHMHQRAFFSHLNILLSAGQLSRLQRRLTFAVPNGGKRDIGTAMRLKEEGVEPGIPDILCLVPSDDYHGLAIEMKAPIIKGVPKPVVSKDQREKIEMLNESGYLATVCYGWNEAISVYLDYLGVKND